MSQTRMLPNGHAKAQGKVPEASTPQKKVCDKVEVRWESLSTLGNKTRSALKTYMQITLYVYI